LAAALAFACGGAARSGSAQRCTRVWRSSCEQGAFYSSE